MTGQDLKPPSRRWLIWALVFDAAALGILYYQIPNLRRPLEIVFIVLAVLCALTAFAAGPRRPRNALVIGTSVFATLFFLELGQKFFDLTELFQRRPPAAGPADNWSWKNAEEYLEVKRRAIAEGLLPPEDDFAGDIFTGQDNLLINAGSVLVTESLKPSQVTGPPLGTEYVPGNRIRFYARHRPTGAMLFDSAITINEYGFRETRGNPDSDETYIFLGCSITFGYGLSDHQTMPHYFSGAAGFEKRVINLALSGYGVHQALRELELDHHASRAGLDPGQVKGVFFGFFDGHIFRMENPRYTASPYYVLRNGRPVYAGTYMEHTAISGSSRFNILMTRARTPFLRERLSWTRDRQKLEELWEITLAMLGEMNRLCLEKYGVPLTVVYWDNHQPALDKFAEWGMPVIKVKEAFAARGDYLAVKYMLHDAHPSAYANEVLGRYVYDNK